MSMAIILSPISAMDTVETTRYPHDDDEAFMTAAYQQVIQDSMMARSKDDVALAKDNENNGSTTTSASDNASVPSLHEDDNDNDDGMLVDETIDNDESTQTMLVEKNGIAIGDSYGGLRNLGNTCYMASALQLLSGLDRFVSRLEETDIPEENQKELRTEFLDLMKRLRSGEMIEPRKFKQAIDTRSPLFVGYRQQDSHEFLTALLDLLDEDYQIKKEEKTEEERDGNDETKRMEEVAESRDDAADGSNDSDGTAQAFETAPSSPLRSSPSFSKLTVDGISNLLHGSEGLEKKQQAATTRPTDSSDGVVCKLVGGRAVIPQDSLVPLSGTPMPNNAESVKQTSFGPTEMLGDPVFDTTAELSPEEVKKMSPVEEYFTTEVRACLTCDSCKYTRSHNEKFLHLSLDVSAESTVEDGLRKFFAPERRDIKCEKCFGESATQTLEIVKLPRAMLLHLKRFIVDVSPDWTSITYRKDQSAVEYRDSLSLEKDVGVLGEFLAKDVTIPEALDRPSFLVPPADDDDDDDVSMLDDDEERAYKIRSIVNHIGSSAQCGHYTSDAFRLYNDGTRQWTRFNDSMVDKTLSKDTAMGSTTTAYMIMYELD